MDNNIKNNLGLLKHRGFSLVELLIAIPLGLLVMLAVLQIFTTNIQGVRLENAFSRVQENGRIAQQLIIQDIRLADHWGCIHDTSLINNPDSSTSILVPSGQPGVSGVDNYSVATVIDGITIKLGTDTLTLRGAQGFSDAKIEAAMASVSANISFTAGNGLAKDDLVLIGNCKVADIFVNTSTVDGTLSHGNALSDVYGIDAQVLAPYVKTYFIGTKAGIDSLYRLDNGGTDAAELVRGVSDLQIMYGIDASDNGSAETYSIASADPAVMGQAVSIQVSLTSENVGTPLQRTYTVTANIRNRTLQ